MRNGNPQCKKCFEEKLIEEAKMAGLELLGPGKNANYRIYKCKKCEHIQKLQINNVRKKNFRCKSCFEIKLNEEASAAGLELIGEGKTAHYKLYKFIDCGHEQEIQTSQVRNNNVTCKTCFDEKLKEEANSNGLDLVRECENSNYRLYKFIDCEHEQEIAIRHVRDQNFICHKCKGVWLKNGLLVKSKLEQLVGNWLIDQGIKFKYEVYLSSNSRHKTDFYLEEKDIYIEVAGYITRINVTIQNSVDEIIQQLRNDPDNYRDYTKKLIRKITNYYVNRNLIVLTAKNLKDKRWKDSLKKNIELISK